MSTFVLEREGRVERHRTESRVLKGLASAFSFALPLACAVGTWMVLLQMLEGAHTTSEPGLLVQILRAVTLALPALLIATSGALAVSDRLCSAARVGPRLRAATTSTLVGFATAAVFAAWHPVHSWLFGGYVHYSGTELAPAAYMLRDGILALAVALPVSAAIVLVARRRAAAPRRANGLARGLTAAGATLGLALVGLGSLGLGGGVAAGAGTLGACPANASVRHFDVQAIDVNITLNRFGDNDPLGKMYVLTNRVAAVRAAGGVAHGLHRPARRRHPAARDSCQRGRLRRDHVTPTTPPAAPFGIHIDGLSYDIGSSGDAVGKNAASAPVHGGEHHYRYYVPNDPALEGAHYMRPGPGNRLAVAHGLFGALVVEPQGSTYLNADDGQPLESGWEAMISPPARKAFREYVLLFHEIGNEQTERRHPSTRTAAAADDRPAHRRLPPRLARHQLPLGAVHRTGSTRRRTRSRRPTAATPSATRPRRRRAPT